MGIYMDSRESLMLLRGISRRLQRFENAFSEEIEKAERKQAAEIRRIEQEVEEILAEYKERGLPERYSRPLALAKIPFIKLFYLSDDDLLAVRNLGRSKLKHIRECQERHRESVEKYFARVRKENHNATN